MNNLGTFPEQSPSILRSVYGSSLSNLRAFSEQSPNILEHSPSNLGQCRICQGRLWASASMQASSDTIHLQFIEPKFARCNSLSRLPDMFWACSDNARSTFAAYSEPSRCILGALSESCSFLGRFSEHYRSLLGSRSEPPSRSNLGALSGPPRGFSEQPSRKILGTLGTFSYHSHNILGVFSEHSRTISEHSPNNLRAFSEQSRSSI